MFYIKDIVFVSIILGKGMGRGIYMGMIVCKIGYLGGYFM